MYQNTHGCFDDCTRLTFPSLISSSSSVKELVFKPSYFRSNIAFVIQQSMSTPSTFGCALNEFNHGIQQVSNGWVFRQKGEDLTLNTRSNGRGANRLRHRGIILEFKNGSLRGTLTLKDLEGLKKCVSGLQQVMQEQKNQESNLDI